MFQRHLESVDMCIMENIQKEIDSLGIMICSRGIKSVITTQRPLELLSVFTRKDSNYCDLPTEAMSHKISPSKNLHFCQSCKKLSMELSI